MEDEEETFGEALIQALEDILETEREYDFTDAYHRQHCPVIPLSGESIPWKSHPA